MTNWKTNVIGGLDTHKRTHMVAVLSATGVVVDGATRQPIRADIGG